MAFHSKFNDQNYKTVCGIALCPLKTNIQGPAPTNIITDIDIIDEAIQYYRANLFFKNYDLKGSADVLLIYLISYITSCLQIVSNEPNITNAKAKLISSSKTAIQKPSKTSFLSGLIKDTGAADAELFVRYIGQAKEELVKRLIPILYDENGPTFEYKFWVGLSKRKFMDLTYY